MKRIRVAALTFLSGVVVAATIGLNGLLTAQERSADGGSDADAAKLISNYQKWTNAGADPHFVPPRIAPGSTGPLPVPRQSADPHEDSFVKVYINDTGSAEFMSKKRPRLPEGTVVVSEKRSSKDTNAAPVSLAVMVKRGTGFEPHHGNWEFLSFNGDGTKVTARGKVTESCVECHAVQSPLDFVFRGYFNQDMRNQLK